VSVRRVAIACGLVAVATSAIAVIATISAQSGSVTTLVRIAYDDPIAPLASEIDPGFRFVEPGGHYDGSFFYAVAIDPLATGEAHELIDRNAYRYGHPGYGWAAWVLSAGQPSLVPFALVVLGLVGVGVAAACGSLLAARFGWSPWWGGLLIAFSPGLIFSVTADTSEPIALALMGLLLLAYLNQRWVWVAVLSACACLTKEPLIAVPIGLALWELLRARRGATIPDLTARIAAVGVGPVVFVLWMVYLRTSFGIWPSSQTVDLVTLPPFAGWIDTFGRAADLARRGDDPMQVGTAAIAFLPAIGGALIVGAVRAFRLRTILDLLYLLFALMVFCLNWLQLLAPKDLIRLVVLAFALLPAVLMTPAGGGSVARTRDDEDRVRGGP
jgi:hypothetical protein